MCRSPSSPPRVPAPSPRLLKGHAMAPSIPRSGRGHLTMAAVAAIALAAALLVTSPVAAQSASSSSVAAIERRMAELANQSRAAVGARPVAVDVKFAAASRDWSCQMARTKNFAHDPNFAAGGALAEIIAARSGADGDVGAQLHQQFLDSSAHREILLNPAYTRVGIGVCVLNGYWVTERFGTGAAVAAPAPTTPTSTPSTTRPPPRPSLPRRGRPQPPLPPGCSLRPRPPSGSGPRHAAPAWSATAGPARSRGRRTGRATSLPSEANRERCPSPAPRSRCRFSSSPSPSCSAVGWSCASGAVATARRIYDASEPQAPRGA